MRTAPSFLPLDPQPSHVTWLARRLPAILVVTSRGLIRQVRWKTRPLFGICLQLRFCCDTHDVSVQKANRESETDMSMGGRSPLRNMAHIGQSCDGTWSTSDSLVTEHVPHRTVLWRNMSHIGQSCDGTCPHIGQSCDGTCPHIGQSCDGTWPTSDSLVTEHGPHRTVL